MLTTSVYLPPSGARPHSAVEFPGNEAAVAALPSGDGVISRKQARIPLADYHNLAFICQLAAVTALRDRGSWPAHEACAGAQT